MLTFCLGIYLSLHIYFLSAPCTVNASPISTILLSFITPIALMSRNYEARYYAVFSSLFYLLHLTSKYSPWNLCLNTTNIRSSFRMKDQVPHAHKTTENHCSAFSNLHISSDRRKEEKHTDRLWFPTCFLSNGYQGHFPWE